MKRVLFVPGFQEDLHFRDYTSVITAIEKKGYVVTLVPINWKRTTIDDWSKELDTIYSGYEPSETILAGFSYGAMTALVCTAKRNPSELWLFSLSPYFAEDVKSKNMKATWLKHIGKRRTAAFSKLVFKDLAKNIPCKTLLFYGQAEIDMFPVMKERSIDAHKSLRNNELMIINDTRHDVSDKRYIDMISTCIEV